MNLANRKIFIQAWQIAKTQKFLHLFGLFLVLPAVPTVIYDWLTAGSNPTSPSLAPLVVSLVVIVFYVLSLRAKAGVIIAVKALLEKEPTSFKKGFQAAKMFYGRIFLMDLLIGVTVMVLAIILIGTVGHFAAEKNFSAVWVLGGLASLIGIAAVVVAFLVQVLAPMFIVIFDQKVQESLDRSLALIKAALWQLVGFGLLTTILQIMPVVILSILTYYIHDLAARIVILAAALTIQIGIIVFVETAWVIKFLELVRPEKLDEEVLPLAETASN